MSDLDLPGADEETAVSRALRSREAGGRAIRGSALRVGGYLFGLALVAGASVFLLRYLGVDDFGRYVTVIALIGIVTAVADAGLSVVGQREYVVRGTKAGQRALLADLLGIRCILTPVGVALAAGFAAVAGYGTELVIGTLLAGGGLFFVVVYTTVMLPLSATLRLGAVTAIDTGRQAVIFGGIVLLVAIGGSLLAFFAVQIAAGAAALVLTLAFVGAGAWVGPRFSWREWRPLLVEAAPMAASQVVNVVYLRVMVILMSLLSSAFQTGLFATSYRILEIFIGIPLVMVGSAFPILAHAGADDEERLAYALQRLGEASFLVAGLIVVGLAVGAEPIVEILGGGEYEDAGEVLRLQSFALLGAFMTQVWAFGLVALRRQSALIAVNAVALVSVFVLGLALIPPFDARGAAVGAAVGEAILAASTLMMLVRTRRELRPQLGYVLKVLVAGGVAALAVLLPIPELAAAAVACALFTLVAFALRAVPMELVHALMRRKHGAAE